MKSRVLSKLAILTLALASVGSIAAFAQTTDEGPGPSEQPSAPMEVGQEQAPEAQPSVPLSDGSQPGATQPNSSQPPEAQPGGPSGEGPAKTDMGVARVSLIHGDVSTQRGDSGDWSAATLNQPVMGGDKISTGDNARTELQLDFANILRLGPNSKANIATFTQKDIQIQLGQGIADYIVSKDSEVEPEIDTPNVSLHPAHHDGIFRIEVRPDGDTIIMVREGEAQISTPQGSTEIHNGDMATIRGDANSAQYKITAAPERDDWDRWNSDRDHLIRNAQSWHHTNRYYTGSQDLDAYGNWQNVPDYGDVWVPNQSEGWAPYRDGNWTYEPYYGWTWVGYEPWGWAPYHYGRWFSYGGRWAWWPGPLYGGGFYRPFWSPAYVSFWGWGGGLGFGVGFGWGGFGWLPIGPCDWFHPWWGGYRGRFGVFNARFGNFNRFGGFSPLHGGTRFSNVVNIRQAHVFGGMSTVGANRFGAGHVGAMAATHQQLSNARMMAGNLPVVPSRASLSASGRAAAASTTRGGGSEHFYGAVHSNATHAESFERQTAGLRQSMQQSHISPVSGARGAESGARGGEFAGRSEGGSGSMKPSAGTAREMNSGNRGATSVQNGSREGGARPFTPPNSSSSNPGNSRSSGNGIGESSRGTAQSGSTTGRDGFRPFTPPSHSEASRGGESGSSAERRSMERGGSSERGSSESGSMERGSMGGTAERGGSGSYWNRTAPTGNAMGSRGYGSSGYGGGGRLDMRQPIVRGPSNAGGSRPSYGGGYGGGRPAPSYGGSHGGYSGGGHVSGGGGGHPSGAAGGGGHSSGGGGHSGGGGGHGGHR